MADLATLTSRLDGHFGIVLPFFFFEPAFFLAFFDSARLVRRVGGRRKERSAKSASSEEGSSSRNSTERLERGEVVAARSLRRRGPVEVRLGEEGGRGGSLSMGRVR